ncbi:VOC family protein [Winogradskyella aurantia]|nr:VOC family protein [Winogradskyella aurantia]
MKQFITFLLLSLTLINCNQEENKKNNVKAEKRKPIESMDTIPKVTGIGGIFFKSSSPNKTKEWYRDNLGFSVDDYGSPFEFRNANKPEEINYLNWDVFQDSTDYFNPSKKEFMINYRVQNIEGLLRKLKNNGVTIIDEIATYDYGKFVHILDSEGNKIELWEPVDSVLTKMGRQTTK